MFVGLLNCVYLSVSTLQYASQLKGLRVILLPAGHLTEIPTLHQYVKLGNKIRTEVTL